MLVRLTCIQLVELDTQHIFKYLYEGGHDAWFTKSTLHNIIISDMLSGTDPEIN